MRRTKPQILLGALFAVVSGLLTTVAPVRAASREKVLYAFHGGSDGLSPSAAPIFDTAGNMYGTTIHGGDYRCDRYFGCGTVFELELGANDEWSKKVLHTFSGKDGAYPSGGLIFDRAGALYGTTISGGPNGYGTVFKLTPGVNGNWTETVLHGFNSENGALPACALIFDSEGQLYGTTQTGGMHNVGTVFRLAPVGKDKWGERVLYSFNGKDGSDPNSSLIFDSAGNLYGTTILGGDPRYCQGNGCGTVFRLTPHISGKWTETVLHSFDNTDGALPAAGLVFDGSGNLYGTTQEGGDLKSNTCLNYGCGIVFELAPGANDKWIERVLHRFHGWTDGFYPGGVPVFDKAGSLYGTTWYGGTVFKLTPSSGGKWTETVLHAFNGKDGWFPEGDLVFDALGNLYGTTVLGGKLGKCQSQYGRGCGTVFEITP